MRLKSLTKQVSEITNIEEDIVKEVIDHFFTNVKEYITKGDRAIVRLPRFGSFALKIKNTNRLDIFSSILFLVWLILFLHRLPTFQYLPHQSLQ